MTTTAPPPTLEVIDCEKLTRLDEQSAKLLDAKIKEAVGKLADDTYDVLRLLKDAKQGGIHEALGFSSWSAYVCDVVKIVPADKGQRRMLAALMSGEGMSQRAIADVLGVSQKTVDRDLDSAGESNDSTTTAGLDGKTYPREPKATEADVEPSANVEQGLISFGPSRAVAALIKAVDGIEVVAGEQRSVVSRCRLSDELMLVQSEIARLEEIVEKLTAVAMAEEAKA